MAPLLKPPGDLRHLESVHRECVTVYVPNPNSEFRVKFDFRVEFTNGGYVEGKDFLLDLGGDSVSEADLKKMIVQAMNLAKAGPVTAFRMQVVPRGGHNDT